MHNFGPYWQDRLKVDQIHENNLKYITKISGLGLEVICKTVGVNSFWPIFTESIMMKAALVRWRWFEIVNDIVKNVVYGDQTIRPFEILQKVLLNDLKYAFHYHGILYFLDINLP